MACVNCKCKWGTIKAICRVCQLNDNDSAEKFVCHCEVCKAYICEKHWGWNTPFERVEAAVKDKMEKTIEVLENFVKKKRGRKNITEDFGEKDL